jgi:hypothetical protein
LQNVVKFGHVGWLMPSKNKKLTEYTTFATHCFVAKSHTEVKINTTKHFFHAAQNAPPTLRCSAWAEARTRCQATRRRSGRYESSKGWQKALPLKRFLFWQCICRPVNNGKLYALVVWYAKLMRLNPKSPLQEKFIDKHGASLKLDGLVLLAMQELVLW